MPDLSIVIVSWNTQDMLRDCLQSVYEQTQKYTFEVFVVDNNSPDDSAAMVAEEFPEVNLIANADNRGFAPANNQALEQAKGEYILLLNPDTLVLDGAIDRMIDYAKAHADEKIGVLTCKLLNGDGSLQRSVNRFYSFWRSFVENRFFSRIFEKLGIQSDFFMAYWQHDSLREIDWAFGAVMLFKRSLMEEIGMLDDRFYIYAEEVDFYMRSKKAGYRSFFLPDVEIIHFGKSSSRQRRSAMFIQNYKSFYLFLRKHYGRLSYYLYRTRAFLYLLIWYGYFSVKNDEEAHIQRKVYRETIQWHLQRDSRV
jgi:GT2 family glycosyltransferase